MADTSKNPKDTPNPGRRRFLTAATTVVGAAVAGTMAVAMIESLEPTAAEAASASTSVNLEPIEPGMQVTVPWQKKPAIVVMVTALPSGENTYSGTAMLCGAGEPLMTRPDRSYIDPWQGQ